MSASSQRPLRLAYFSPLAPQPTGVSAYSQDLLPYLAPWAEVHLFVDDYVLSDPSIQWKFPVWNYREYPWRREIYRYDCAVYHMGNSRFHRYLYPYVAQFPGVVVLHDFVLHHFLAGAAVDAGLWGLYLRELTYSYGVRGADIATEVLLGGRETLLFEYPLCQRVLDASLGVLVHSQYLVEEVRRLRPGVSVEQVPMGVPLPRDPGPKPLLRRDLELPQDAFILGSFGEATHHKRVPVVLRAFARLLSENIPAYYVIVGNVAPDLDLEGLAKNLGISRFVRVTGYLPAQAYNAYLHAVDVCVNLRYPTAGETSASALRSMAAGVPTIVSDVGANRELPGSCCFKLPVNEEEEALLTKTLQLLATDSDLRRGLGRQARQYVETHHSPAQAARKYIAFLEELVWNPKIPPPLHEERRDGPEFDGEYLRRLASHMKELGLSESDVPFLSELAQALAALGIGPVGVPGKDEAP